MDCRKRQTATVTPAEPGDYLFYLARSGLYRPKPTASASDLSVMRRLDELHLELPFYGSRRMTFELNEEGVRASSDQTESFDR